MEQKPRPNRSETPRRTRLFSGTVLAFITYLLLLLCRLIDVSILNRDNEYFSIIVLQMMVFLLPAFAFLLLRGRSYRDTLPLSGLRADHVLLILGATLLLVCGSLLLEIAVGLGRLPEESFSLYETFLSKNNGTLPRALYLILTYGALPAACEELIFRGIFCTEYQGDGVFCSVGMSMVFFTLLHFDPKGIPVYLFSALILCATLLATRSLFAAMLVHFGYNMFGIFGDPTLTAVFNAVGGRWLFIFVLVTLMLAGGALFCGQAARLYRGHAIRPPKSSLQTPLPPRESLRRLGRHLYSPVAIASYVFYLIVVIFF